MKKLVLLLLSAILVFSGCKNSSTKKSRSIDYAIAPMDKILGTMTLDEKVAQMFIVTCPTVDAPIYAKQYKFSGYIFFGNHFKNSDPETFKSEIQACQDNSSIPMFMSVDEEGGTVTRASRYPQFREKPFPAPRELYDAGGFSAIRKDAKEKSEFLKNLGINLNFAPVCDISQNPDDFIYNRTIGLDAEKTREYVRAVITEMNPAQMGSALKHFPGYGGNADTHTGLSVDKRPIEDFRESDFLPFKAGIEAGAKMVMVSHNIVECMDKTLPASLSPDAHKILREELGFEGVIITDDISMGAITSFSGEENPAVAAILAGNDMICLSGDFKPMIDAVTEAVKNGKISESRIDESVTRIIDYKRSLGFFK